VAVWALTNAAIYADSHDFTGDSNEVRISCEAEPLDRTNMRSGGYRELAMGVKTSTVTAAGMAQFGADTTDEWQFANLGSAGKVITITGQETEGMPTWMLQSMPLNFQYGGSHGELAPFAFNGACSDGIGVVRGQLAVEMAAVSGTGAIGTGLNLGAVSATQFVYSTIHLMGTAGTSITVVIESDDASNFPSATTRITHGSHTTVGGRWGTRAAGSITDTWWRARVTAISGTWTVAVAIGIQ
jgi:hypothetical protein